LPERPGTDEAEARKARIMELQADISAEKLEDRVGDEELVLVDSPHEEWPGLFIGRTWFQAPEVDGVTYISGPEVAPGKMVSAEITEAKTYDLVALS
jgi:tRNA-2-methylthio-N6-dimethylallyladenosine synthase/ribosomal protein S12 methylthiotransferase